MAVAWTSTSYLINQSNDYVWLLLLRFELSWTYISVQVLKIFTRTKNAFWDVKQKLLLSSWCFMIQSFENLFNSFSFYLPLWLKLGEIFIASTVIRYASLKRKLLKILFTEENSSWRSDLIKIFEDLFN